MSCKNRSDSKGKTAPRRERRSPGRGAAERAGRSLPGGGKALAAGGASRLPAGKLTYETGKAGNAPGNPDHSAELVKSRRGVVELHPNLGKPFAKALCARIAHPSIADINSHTSEARERLEELTHLEGVDVATAGWEAGRERGSGESDR